MTPASRLPESPLARDAGHTPFCAPGIRRVKTDGVDRLVRQAGDAGMSRRRWWGSLTVVAMAFAVAGPAVAGSAQALPDRSAGATAPAAAPGDTTSKAEARRVDSVPKPKLPWFDCSVFSPGAQCATVQLPLDYDQPKGATTGVAVLRLKAKDQKHKIGTLFLNPGGPGGSGVQFAASAPYFLSPDLVARFDIVGMDPRGTNLSLIHI